MPLLDERRAPSGPRSLLEAEHAIVDGLAAVDDLLTQSYPGAPNTWQPAHTVYVPGDSYRPELPQQWGQAALQTFEAHLANTDSSTEIFGISPADYKTVADHVRKKLASQPIEDLRLDFEDGYGQREDAAEDADVDRAVDHLVAASNRGILPARVGIRIKSLENDTRARAVRTLTRAVSRLSTHPEILSRFVVTLPKVKIAPQVAAFAEYCERLEEAYGLPRASLRFELQIEAPQAILGLDGTSPLPSMIQVSNGRCIGLHYGAYDFSASCEIAAAHQSMEHPIADYAKAVMQVAVAETGVQLCDGASIVFPIGDADAIRDALKLHARLVSRSLIRGYYQGWDMHPGQLATRFGATYSFFASGAPEATRRLANYAAGTGAEEPSTVRALSVFLLRGINCGALSSVDIEAASAHSLVQLRSISATGSPHSEIGVDHV